MPLDPAHSAGKERPAHGHRQAVIWGDKEADPDVARRLKQTTFKQAISPSSQADGNALRDPFIGGERVARRVFRLGKLAEDIPFVSALCAASAG